MEVLQRDNTVIEDKLCIKVSERDKTAMKDRLFMKLDLVYNKVHINLSSSYNFFFLLK